MKPRNRTAPPSAQAASLRRLILGFRVAQLIHVAARLGVADALSGGPRRAEDLAADVGAHLPSLIRLLRALVSEGVFVEIEPGLFGLTPMSGLLQDGVEGSLRSLAVLYGDGWHWSSYGQLMRSVRTGRPAYEHVHQQPYFDFLEACGGGFPALLSAMRGYPAWEASCLAQACDFSNAGSVVDVGAGQGTLLATVLQRHEHLYGYLFDLPSVACEAQRSLHLSGVSHRIECVAGDFFEELPKGADTYLLKSVLGDWGDAAASRILRNCRRAMRPNSRLIVMERLAPEASVAVPAKIPGTELRELADGHERSAKELATLFGRAGFELVRLSTTETPLYVFDLEPAAA